MKKILVTGGAGFIGSHTVVELINTGYEPVIIDNFSTSEPSVMKGIKEITGKDIKLYKEDCRNKEKLSQIFNAEKNISGVIHFAAYKAVGESSLNPLKYYTNNLESLTSILQVMKEYKVNNLVFSSSCTVYGQPEKLPVTEGSPTLRPESPYGNTKIISEDIIKETVKTSPGLKAMSLRYFNPIGAHPSSLIGELPIGKPSNLVPYITQTGAGIQECLTVFGKDYNTPDGTCIRDYIHVVDLALAHIKALDYLFRAKDESQYKVLNIGIGKGVSVLEIIKAFEKISGLKLNYKLGDRRPGDVESIYAEVKLANEMLGWETALTMEDAVRDAWNWQKKLKKIKN
jgi:UDP-glucose 4-epimerase